MAGSKSRWRSCVDALHVDLGARDYSGMYERGRGNRICCGDSDTIWNQEKCSEPKPVHRAIS